MRQQHMPFEGMRKFNTENFFFSSLGTASVKPAFGYEHIVLSLYNTPDL